jgi:hypothetical protein
METLEPIDRGIQNLTHKKHQLNPQHLQCVNDMTLSVTQHNEYES